MRSSELYGLDTKMRTHSDVENVVNVVRGL